MRIERPRSPKTVTIKGKVFYKVGYAQLMALQLLSKLDKTEAPPKGLITATGVLREHVFNDLIPLDWVKADVRRSGLTDYMLTTIGREVLKRHVVMDPPKRTLLQRQREKVAAGKAAQRAAVLRRERTRRVA